MEFIFSKSDSAIEVSVGRRKRLSENSVPMRSQSIKSPEAKSSRSNVDCEELQLLSKTPDHGVGEFETPDANADLQSFVAAVSHQLRTPLRSITGFSELLFQEHTDQLDDNGRDCVQHIVDGAGKMQKLINRVTEFTQVYANAPSFEQVNLNDIVQHAIDDLFLTIESSNARVTYDLLPTVHGDHAQLQKVFRNLIDNAIRFRGDAPPQVHISYISQGDQCKVTVHDNGIGIPIEDQPEAFVMFHRIGVQNEEDAGLGAGLTICKKIIERHNGKIELDSKPGIGTKVVVSLTLIATDCRVDDAS
jgi:signal transduction histidine kinase